MFSRSTLLPACKRSLEQGNIFAPVCHFVQRGRSAPLHAEIPPLPAPEAGTPPSPDQRQAPPGACSEIRATSGRYASYWNELLFLHLSVNKSVADWFVVRFNEQCPLVKLLVKACSHVMLANATAWPLWKWCSVNVQINREIGHYVLPQNILILSPFVDAAYRCSLWNKITSSSG